MLKRAFAALLAVVCIFLVGMSFPTAAQAQSGGEIYSPLYESNLKDSYVQAIQDCGTPSLECLVHHVYKYIVIEIGNSPSGGVPASATGGGRGSAGDGNTINNLNDAGNSSRINPVAGGLVHLIGQMYAHPPASAGTYVADVLNHANIATPAYAQGIGFAALDPILSLWKTIRNLAYLFFVLVFIVIGFLIMFRSKVGGAEVTAQQAIPNIIVSLIFVTFSYAIAGFLIDIMYLVMFLMSGLFQADSSLENANIIDFNILQIGGLLFKQIGGQYQQNVDLITTMLANLVENSNGLTDFGGYVGGLTLTLILAVAVIFGTFKLFFELLKSYANVVISTVIAPITLMVGAIPGNNVFVPWIRNIAGNLAAFPTVLFIVILFNRFTKLGEATTGGFMPPFMLGRGQPGAIASVMGLALILALPEIVKEVKTAVGAKEGFGTKVSGWAGDRFKSTAKSVGKKTDDAIQLGTTVGAGLVGAGVAYRAGRKEGYRGRRLLRGMITGVDVKDGEGRVTKRGGASVYGGKAWDIGTRIRKQGERIIQGRWMDPEDPTKYLASLVSQNKQDNQLPETPKPETKT